MQRLRLVVVETYQPGHRAAEEGEQQQQQRRRRRQHRGRRSWTLSHRVSVKLCGPDTSHQRGQRTSHHRTAQSLFASLRSEQVFRCNVQLFSLFSHWTTPVRQSDNSPAASMSRSHSSDSTPGCTCSYFPYCYIILSRILESDGAEGWNEAFRHRDPAKNQRIKPHRPEVNDNSITSWICWVYMTDLIFIWKMLTEMTFSVEFESSR